MANAFHAYGAAVARHYAAFRPPLHAPLVRDAMGSRRSESALDVGCGTGQSTVALKAVADRVIGVDTSEAMLALAISRAGIDYRLGEGARLPVDAGTTDLISLAGVLPYLDRDAFLAEAARVTRPGALILVYDFRVGLGLLKEAVGLITDAGSRPYDHSLNLKDATGVETLSETQKGVSLTVTPEEAAHLLLASEARFARLAGELSAADPFAAVTDVLSAAAPVFELEAETWSALHRLA